MAQGSPASGSALALQVPDALVEAIASRVVELLEERTGASASTSSPYLTVPEAAEYLRCSPQAIYDRISQGALQPVRDGRKVLLTRTSLDDHVSQGLA